MGDGDERDYDQWLGLRQPSQKRFLSIDGRPRAEGASCQQFKSPNWRWICISCCLPLVRYLRPPPFLLLSPLCFDLSLASLTTISPPAPTECLTFAALRRRRLSPKYFFLSLFSLLRRPVSSGRNAVSNAAAQQPATLLEPWGTEKKKTKLRGYHGGWLCGSRPTCLVGISIYPLEASRLRFAIKTVARMRHACPIDRLGRPFL